jgi:hypothetical protein
VNFRSRYLGTVVLATLVNTSSTTEQVRAMRGLLEVGGQGRRDRGLHDLVQVLGDLLEVTVFSSRAHKTEVADFNDAAQIRETRQISVGACQEEARGRRQAYSAYCLSSSD